MPGPWELVEEGCAPLRSSPDWTSMWLPHGPRHQIPEHRAVPGTSSLEDRAANVAPAARMPWTPRRRLLAPLPTHSRLRLRRKGRPSEAPFISTIKKKPYVKGALCMLFTHSAGPSAAGIDCLLRALCRARHLPPYSCGVLIL